MMSNLKIGNGELGIGNWELGIKFYLQFPTLQLSLSKVATSLIHQ
jgi:hypothetical protein